MAKLLLDSNGVVRTPTIVMSNKKLQKLGVINNIDASTLTYKNSQKCPEMSFDVIKETGGVECRFWDELEDLCVIGIVEYNEFFEAEISISDADETRKSVTCTFLPVAELSQINLYNVEINTEDDINRVEYEYNVETGRYEDVTIEDYYPTFFYNAEKPQYSLLHRIIKDKAPHYSIGKVDETLVNIQRSFSFNGTSIFDAMGDIEEQVGCKFIFDSATRTFDVVDMYRTCSSCGYRGEFLGECPKCGSNDVIESYGDNTNIYISKENLADSISISGEAGSLKNCFRLATGDENMDAAVVNLNPNGSRYIYYFSDDLLEKVSPELKSALEAYNTAYDVYYKGTMYDIGSAGTACDTVATKYNGIAYGTTYYQQYGYDENNIKTLVNNDFRTSSGLTSYEKLIDYYYSMQQLYAYLSNGLLPVVDPDQNDTATNQLALIVSALNANGLAVTTNASTATFESTLKLYCQAIINSTKAYNVEVSVTNKASSTFTATISLTCRSDDEDYASGSYTFRYSASPEDYSLQQVQKAIAKNNNDIGSVFNVIGDAELINENAVTGTLKTNIQNALKLYSASRLESFNDAVQSGLDILMAGYVDNSYYKVLYDNYYAIKGLINTELELRDSEVDKVMDAITQCENIIDGIHDALDMRVFLNTDELWNEYHSYRREDEYTNDNFISEGLSDSELISRAEEFLELARDEVENATKEVFSISAPLANLLVIPAFSSLWSSFDIYNWLTLRADDKLYRLRLLSYKIDFDDSNIGKIDVEFTNARRGVEISNVLNDVKQMLNQVNSMSSTYSHIEQRSIANEKKTKYVSDWVKEGLNATRTKILNTADVQTVTYDQNGILIRTFDDVENDYTDEQVRMINSTIAFTDDGWRTIKTALGKFVYVDTNGNTVETYGLIADTIVGSLIAGEDLVISGTIKSSDYSYTSGNFTNQGFIIDMTNNFIRAKNFVIDSSGNASFTGAVNATSLTLGSGVTVAASNVSGLSSVATSGSYSSLSGTPDLTVYIQKDGTLGTVSDGSTGFVVSTAGLLQASNAIIYGTIYASNGSIGGWTIGASSLYSTSSAGKITGLQNQNNGTWAIAVAATTMADWSTAPFRVSHAGALVATNATITGSVTATGGKIGVFNLNNALYTSSNSFGTVANNIYIGSSGISLGTTFSVTAAGAMTSTSGTIGGWTIDGTTGITRTGVSGKISLLSTGNIQLESGSYNASFTWVTNGTMTITGTHIHATTTSTNIYAYFNYGTTIGYFYTTSSSSTPRAALYPDGMIYASSEIRSTATLSNGGNFRAISGNYGTIFRNDGSNFYILLTDSGDEYGTWNSLRPLIISLSGGGVSSGTNWDIYSSANKTFNIRSTGGTADLNITTASSHEARVTVNNGVHAGKFQSSSGDNLGIYDNTNSKWVVYSNSSGTVTVNTSDRRAKNYIQDTTQDSAIDLLRSIKIRQFTYKDDEHGVVTNGIFAQDIRDYLISNNMGYRSYLNIQGANGDEEIYYDLTMDEDKVQYGLEYHKLVPELWLGWQYHDDKITRLEKRIEVLESLLVKNNIKFD